VRILFTFIGGSGHFYPLVPIARAARAAGHDVAVAGSGGMVETIQAAGFTAFPTSERRPPKPHIMPPLEPADLAREDQVLRDGFAGVGARRHATVLPGIVRTWQPDVLVRDEVDFGAGIVAELLGIPCAVVLVLAAGSFLRQDLVADPLRELRAELGLPADPALSMLDSDLVLSPFPPSFRSPAFPLPDTALSYRSVDPSPVGDRRTVYVTLGTIDTYPELFERVITGLRDLPVDVVVTVGKHLDPAQFGPQPDNVRIERFIPQDEVLPHCCLVVSHAGSGSLLGAFTYGLPSILLPLGADQPHNARRCAELGVGRELDPVTATPHQIHATAATMLADPACRRAAEELRDELDALPGVTEALHRIERLHQAT
jgi:UDP:flavonoid glycosyltransferase YjiC (YdhE family)